MINWTPITILLKLKLFYWYTHVFFIIILNNPKHDIKQRLRFNESNCYKLFEKYWIVTRSSITRKYIYETTRNTLMCFKLLCLLNSGDLHNSTTSRGLGETSNKTQEQICKLDLFHFVFLLEDSTCFSQFVNCKAFVIVFVSSSFSELNFGLTLKKLTTCKLPRGFTRNWRDLKLTL